LRTDFEVTPVEFNGEGSHLHRPMNLPPMVALSKLVNPLNGVPRSGFW